MNNEPTPYERDRMRGVVGFFTRLVVDGVDVAAMVWDWFMGNFDWSPSRLMVALVLGVAYLVSPIDIVPDTIPLAGWIDDLLVVTSVIRLARFDLERYRRWKSEARRVA